MDYEQFALGIRSLVEKTPLFGREKLESVLVINPRAGGFAHPARYRRALKSLQAAVTSSSEMPTRGADTAFRTLPTDSPRHASRFAINLLEEAAIKPGSTWLIILACGDGTSLEFLDELSRAPSDIRERFTMLRLPMGTGNDASDGRFLDDSLSRLLEHGSIERQCALLVKPNPAGPANKRTTGSRQDDSSGGHWRSFNIASIGLDAYVTHKTNQLKASMPGDSYKLWLDIASVFYDKVYPPRDMLIIAKDAQGKETARYDGLFLLVAMGVSGCRTYGSNKPILPDADTVCAVRQMPLMQKLALKTRVAKGLHRSHPAVCLFSADTLEIHYSGKLLVQMDGEAELLQPEDFPLVMERTGPIIRYLARRD